jgi:hypothetical protein
MTLTPRHDRRLRPTREIRLIVGRRAAQRWRVGAGKRVVLEPSPTSAGHMTVKYGIALYRTVDWARSRPPGKKAAIIR